MPADNVCSAVQQNSRHVDGFSLFAVQRVPENDECDEKDLIYRVKTRYNVTQPRMLLFFGKLRVPRDAKNRREEFDVGSFVALCASAFV